MQIQYGKKLWCTMKTVWWKCENWTPRSVEKLFPFNYMDIVIQYYQWETIIVERKDKKDLWTTKKMSMRSFKCRLTLKLSQFDNASSWSKSLFVINKLWIRKYFIFSATKRMMKNGTIEKVIEHLINLRSDFSIHNLTNINQLHNFKQAKKNLKPNELIISEDFSENYSLKHQHEIMLVHWSQEELSLFCIQPIIWKMENLFSNIMFYVLMA